MKVALVHDYLKEYGGAERVLEALHEIYPSADVFTSVYLPEYLGPHKERFKDWNIKTSWLQRIPFKAKLISPFRLLSPFVFKRFDFSAYDVVITSATGAYFPNTLTKGKAKLVCYCHTPPRYLYGYATARELTKNKIIAGMAAIANHILRMVDFSASQNVDYFIANSHEVKRRINKFYRKDAVVIYPPVDVSSTYQVVSSKNKKDTVHNTGYYLAGGRLARPKHIDLIVKTCTENKLPLIVFGKGFAGYGEELKQIAGKTIEFVGEVSDAEKLELMKGAKAYLFASVDEDLGITPIEAMGQGIPVVAYRSGGVQETVIENKTGLFFDELSTQSLENAIKKLEKVKIKSEDCVMQAKKFSTERFKTEIQMFVTRNVKAS